MTSKNGFTKKKIPSITLGEKLRDLRIERGYELTSVSQKTNIPIKYLQHIEDGAYDKLPPAVYVRGFLRNYARFFKIAPKPLLKLYEREAGIHNTLAQERNPTKEQKGGTHTLMPRLVITPKIIISTVIIVLIICGAWYLFHAVNRFITDPLLIIEQPHNEAHIEQKAVEIIGQTDKGNKIFINDQEVFPEQDGTFKEHIELHSGANTVRIRAINAFEKKTEHSFTLYAPQDVEPTVEENEKADAEQATTPDEVNVELRTQDKPVWITVASDGENVYSKKMPVETVETFIAKEKIVITAGIGNKVFVKVNGEDRGALGESSSVVRDITFTNGEVEDKTSEDGEEIENTESAENSEGVQEVEENATTDNR